MRPPTGRAGQAIAVLLAAAAGLFVVGGFALLFAALDRAEAADQRDEDDTGLAVLAAIIAALHAAAALIVLHGAAAAPEREPAPA
jgi:hypothetical protein